MAIAEPTVTSVGGYFSPKDQFQHAIAVTRDGALHEIFFNPTKGVFSGDLGCFRDVVASAAFFTPDDGFQHVIVATKDGNIREVFFDPSVGIHLSEPPLANFRGIVGLAAFVTTDDKFRIVIVATDDGNIREIFYHPSVGVHVTQPPLARFNGIVSVAGFATTEDNFRHVIVGAADGAVHEIFYSPRSGKGQDVLRRFPGVPFTEDVAPDVSNAVPNPYGGTTTGGMMLAVAGNQNTLYAVSLSAGVWRATTNGAWTQLPRSPQRSYSIAVDPTNVSHVVVGERDGDATTPVLNRSGVWESSDAGDNWRYVFNPFNDPGCVSAGSQAVPSVAFDSLSNVYAATACGVAKRPAGGGAFQILNGTGGQGPFTTVATQTVSGTQWIWGRTTDNFFVSKNGGATWEQTPIPATVGPDAVKRGARGDSFSLAAYDKSAFTIVSTNRGSATISYDAETKVWSLADIKDGDGTGLGGRRFVKAYLVNLPLRPWILLAGTAQGVFMSTGGSSLSWQRIAETPWPLAGTETHTFNPTSDIHVDLWDAHVGSGPAPALWLASDGGVHRSDSALTGVFPGTPPYVHQNQGLHTHYVNTIAVASRTPVSRAHVAYTTADNDAWVWDSSSWQTPNVFGDANWTDGDAANGAVALLSRNKENPWLTGFGQNLPTGGPWNQTTINSDLSFEGAQFHRYLLQFIQTLAGESPTYPQLDAVLMQRRPLGNPAPNGELVLIRNRNFSANPNFNMANLANWPVELNNLPSGTGGFWVSGGHANPSYYLYTNDSGALTLYKRTGNLPPPNQTPWQPLSVTGLVDGSAYGPAFVDPYDPNRLFVITNGGIKVSTNGGFSFTDDTILTNLVTASGKYPITGAFPGGNSTNIVMGGKAAMSTLSHAAFCRDQPGEMVVASPFTGVFYSSGSGRWQSLTPFLPLPHTSVPGVGIDCEAVYVALEGRGVVRVRGYRDAPLAAYFQPVGRPAASGPLAILLASPQDPVANESVLLEITRMDGSSVFNGTVKTNVVGALALPGAVPSGTYVAHVRSTGSTMVASTETSFSFTF